ncbi:GspH/FimT family pseudopilin [Polynucleobacter sp. MWH-UH19D]|uniref:GspH/FimT family pseudopilin n=1 Tax=Polynucleobacter sp. MWH-UH19D TaxID=1855610 RepID=UPI00336529F7
MSKCGELGFSLLELMAVLLIIAITAMFAMPLIYKQVATREIMTVARKWVGSAQFARQQAFLTGESVRMAPRSKDDWNQGWVIQQDCSKQKGALCAQRVLISQGNIKPIFFAGSEKQFRDPHTGELGIRFNVAGAAKTAKGGFVANRLILGHIRKPGLERHLILGSGGRWRICDPAKDARRCH